jgi:hypothetical protein
VFVRKLHDSLTSDHLRDLRASLQDQVNIMHLWNLFLHRMVVRSSTSIPTTVHRRRKRSSATLR